MSRLFTVTLWTCILLSIPMIFLTLSNLLLVESAAGLLSLVFGALYLVVVLLFFSRSPLWPDFRSHSRHPDGSRRRGQGSAWQWVLASLLWGSMAAVGLVMLAGFPILDLVDKLNWDFFMASFVGAYPEEIAKSLGVALILLSFRQLNRPWHGLVTGALVGLGFEVNENILYGAVGALTDPNSDLSGLLHMWQVRTIAGPLIHTVLTALAGYGIALALFRAGRSTAWRVGVAAGWIGLAFLLHFLWNMLWESTVAATVTYVIISLLMYPLFGYLIWRSWREARGDTTYAYAPAAITTTAELTLVDAPEGRGAAPVERAPVSPPEEQGDPG